MDAHTAVLAINLDRDTDRRDALRKKCAQVGINPTRISAVCGKDLSTAELRRKTTASCNNYCTPSMVGCWLSHRKCWQYIVDNDIPSALVLEDDANFVPQFHEKLATYTQTLPSDWELLLLGTILTCTNQQCGIVARLNSAFVKLFLKPLNKADHILSPDVFTGTQAYMVTLSGAEKLLKLLPLADGHIDHGISRHLDELKAYSITPSLVYQEADANTTTQHSNFPYLGTV